MHAPPFPDRPVLWLSLLRPLHRRAPPLDTNAEHGLLMDAATGQVLWQKDGMTPMPPASMSKLMTLELLFQRLKDGRMKLTDTLAGVGARLAHPGLQDVRGTGHPASRSKP